ncbi:ATP-dependent helicase Lhr and Lhr-like helicase [Algoriphagus aquimarinus]|uniref:ATP-dependent helicase Lhr and Lhr-like helicase n=2 Tax=Algoriphagus aquimarinus TaxID=237018 RepID=A0A1I1BKA1_9BACT|nr:ATP-dependent helicase Lhr and Lhr-like helicase [Algoriphagus aquimarinus]
MLSEPIRRFIRDKGWESLRPIQNAAITKILGTEDNYILVSRTASGKTEAAFLPILSKVNFMDKGVQVLYISPLIALINDQFARVEDLCKYLDVKVTKWHGEANRTVKEKLVKDPSGIILITPESLEAMFVNRPYQVKALFSDLRYVVIDEIHSFIGTDRGIQLQSILSRLQQVNSSRFSLVGLSATMSESNKFLEVKSFTGDVGHTKILIDRTPKEINAVFRFFKADGEELPLELLKDLYKETKDSKVLIFPNSRGRAEEVAVKLKKISDRVKGHPNYFSHHSSVDRQVREYVEYFAKNNTYQNFCISCTSTLELGIDIGSVDEVVQIDSTHSIASLIQRVGRSGRKDDQQSNLFLYATEPWSLLQSIACWLLYREGFIEPSQVTEKPFDILLHQALSITKGHSGLPIAELIDQLGTNSTFKHIKGSEIKEIIDHLIEIDLLEKLRQEVIIGVEGEKLVNSRNFYSMFQSEDNFKVVNAGNNIGEVPYSPQLVENENILLAARIWKIKFVDEQAKRVEVIPANDGKKPIFFGGAGAIHPKVREKMFEILYSTESYDFLDEPSAIELNVLRKDFSVFDIIDQTSQRPLKVSEKKLEFFTFTGSRINRTIQFLFDMVGIVNLVEEQKSALEIKVSDEEFNARWGSWKDSQVELDLKIQQKVESSPSIMSFSKWAAYLPISYQIRLLKQKYFDFDSAEKLLDQMQPVRNGR